MVMGDNSCSKGHGLKSQRRILDGHFFIMICCINGIVSLKRLKINEKEAGVGPFKKEEATRAKTRFKATSPKKSYLLQMNALSTLMESTYSTAKICDYNEDPDTCVPTLELEPREFFSWHMPAMLMFLCNTNINHKCLFIDRYYGAKD